MSAAIEVMMKTFGWICAVVFGFGALGTLVGCTPADDATEITQQGLDEMTKQWADNTPQGWQRVTPEKYTYAVPADWKFSKKEGADTYATKWSASGGLESVIVTSWVTSPDSLSNLKTRMVAELEKLGAQNVAPYKETVNPANSEGAENSAITKFRMPTDGGLADGYQVLIHFRDNKWIQLMLTTSDENPDALFEKILSSLIFYP